MDCMTIISLHNPFSILPTLDQSHLSTVYILHSQLSISSFIKKLKIMSHNMLHNFLSLSSKSSVPFSWEEQPGISKSESPRVVESAREEERALRLPPPPASPQVSADGASVRLPPCLFQPWVKSCERKRRHTKKLEDPFLAAYFECTKSVNETMERPRGRARFGLSCKDAGGVREDAIVRLSRFRVLHPRDF